MSATVMLNHLRTSPEFNKGYDRDKFAGWLDEDGNGCDTREEVLVSESRESVIRGSGCAVDTGVWVSAYDAQTFTDPSGMDIDHMVPLAEAWGSGARSWTPAERAAYANDLGYKYDLRAVSASSNRSKADRDPAEWLPPRTDFRCEYVKEFIAVKYRWRLRVDPAERLAMQQVLDGCHDARILRPVRLRVEHGSSGGGGTGKNCSPHYSGACIPVRDDVDCSEIPDRNFGVVDVDVYRLDSDGNGIACEQ